MRFPQRTRVLPGSCSSQADDKAPLLKIISQLIEHRELEMVSTESLYPYIQAPLLQEGKLHATTEKP